MHHLCLICWLTCLFLQNQIEMVSFLLEQQFTKAPKDHYRFIKINADKSAVIYHFVCLCLFSSYKNLDFSREHLTFRGNEFKTIESELMKALVQAGAIPQEHADTPQQVCIFCFVLRNVQNIKYYLLPFDSNTIKNKKYVACCQSGSTLQSS